MLKKIGNRTDGLDEPGLGAAVTKAQSIAALKPNGVRTRENFMSTNLWMRYRAAVMEVLIFWNQVRQKMIDAGKDALKYLG